MGGTCRTYEKSKKTTFFRETRWTYNRKLTDENNAKLDLWDTGYEDGNWDKLVTDEM